MKKRLLSTLLVLCMVLTMLICPVIAASVFPDVGEYDEYVEAVEYVSELKIMIGDENENFNPNKTLTRAEMAVIICKMLGMTENLPVSSAFSDVPVSHWANRYIGKAAELGIVSGYGDGKYGPSDNLTYEQTVSMIIRAIGGGEVAILLGGYPDGYLAVAEENLLLDGIMAEKGEPLSRSDIAIILYNYYMLSLNG